MSFGQGSSVKALTLATFAFAMNFSVWVLYAVLAVDLQTQFSLTGTQLGLVFAAPMLSGALSRIPAGILADKYNPKHLYSMQMLITAPSLFFLPYANTINEYMLLGLWIGLSGSSFTLGIRYLTDWYKRSEQGTAMGIFGAGNAGAALTLAIAPLLVNHWGLDWIGPIYGAALLVTTLLFAWLAPDAARRKLPEQTTPYSTFESEKVKGWITHVQVWRFGLYYYFVFGSFLALLLWLPQYYVHAYETNFETAMALTLVFATSSSMVRALGGWFSDRYGGRSVNWMVFWICLVCLFFLSYPPTTMTIHGIDRDVHLNIEVNIWVFSILIFIIGIAQGFGRASVYKIIHDYYPNQMGEIGGFVAAIGALGGATLPLAFGMVVDWVGIYSACFMMLYGVLAVCMMTMFFAVKADQQDRLLQSAIDNNFLEQDAITPLNKSE